MFEVEIMREDEAVKVGGWAHPLHRALPWGWYTWLDQTDGPWNSVLEGGGGVLSQEDRQSRTMRLERQVISKGNGILRPPVKGPLVIHLVGEHTIEQFPFCS